MGIEQVLVLGVDAPVTIVAGGTGRVGGIGIDLRVQAEGADHRAVGAPLVAEREAPVGVLVLQDLLGPLRDAEALAHERPEAVRRAVGREFRIEKAVPIGVDAGSRDVLREPSREQGRDRGARASRHHVEAPRRRGVPGILHRRVVVQRGAHDEVVARGDEPVREADVEVVGGRVAGPVRVRGALRVVVVVGDLDEGPDAVGDLPGEEGARGLEDGVAVLREVRGTVELGIGRARAAGPVVARDAHHRQRHGALADRVARELEKPPVRGEIGELASGMAGEAVLARLPVECGNRFGPRAGKKRQRQEREPRVSDRRGVAPAERIEARIRPSFTRADETVRGRMRRGAVAKLSTRLGGTRRARNGRKPPDRPFRRPLAAQEVERVPRASRCSRANDR